MVRGHGGGWDPSHDGDLVAPKERLVHADRRPRAQLTRNRDVVPSARGRAEAPQLRSGVEAQHGVLPGCQNGGHPPAVRAEHPVAHGVHPVVDAMKPSALEAVFDGAPADAHGPELPVRHAAVLPLGQLGDQSIHGTRVQKPMTVMGKCRCV
jgi:hypothetical protein